MNRRRLILASLSSLVVLPLATPGTAWADGTSTIHVVGNGRTFVTPDLASVQVQTSRTSTTRQKARARVGIVVSNEVARIVAAGIPRADIQTSSVSLESTKVKVHGVSKRRYVAEVDLTVTVRQISRLSDVLNAASSAGADTFSGPDFTFSNPSAGLIAATNAALVDARQRADAAAAQEGMHVTGVQSIDLDPGSGSSSGSATYASAPVAASSGGAKRKVTTPVLPGQEEVDAAVEVVFTMAANPS